MSKVANNEEEIKISNDEFAKLLDQDPINIPKIGEIIKAKVISASKSEVKLDIAGVLIGVVRGPELYNEVPEYSDLKIGDEVDVAVIDDDNERGEIELSFRLVGQEKAWSLLHQAFKEKESIKVRIVDANKGGLISRFRQIEGFLPVSQLAPENYPRVVGGDKSKILEKLKSFVGQEFEVTVLAINEEDSKIIFSEKDVWSKKQQPSLDKYKVGMQVEGKITAITNFGVFVTFGEDVEGLIHISELAWQRIDSPNEMFQVGEVINAEIITIEGAKVFLSAKKLIKDPWLEASAKYKVGQVVEGTILKINPFGLFVKLDEEIHGLAHISQLNLNPKERLSDLFKIDEVRRFTIVSISPAEHRLGLQLTEKINDKTNKDKKEKIENKESIQKDSDVKKINISEDTLNNSSGLIEVENSNKSQEKEVNEK